MGTAKSSRLRAGLSLMAAATALTVAGSAAAFKPTTHVALGEMAYDDAVADGKVTVYEVVGGKPSNKVVGQYNLDARVLAALKQHGDAYRAGILGPDAYPDIMTGQQIIHPLVTLDPDEHHHKGTDVWLQHIYDSAQQSKSDRAMAFALGYLTHGAGDMFAHTYVNYYAGGDFELGENAIRHLVFEGYLADKGPKPKGSVSISGLEDFIYHTLTNGRRGTKLGLLFKGSPSSTTAFSVPAQFSKLRDDLACDVAQWNAKTQPYRTTHPIEALKIEYKKAWIKDIDDGLKAWPAVSHKVGVAIMYNQSAGYDADWKKAQDILDDYVNKHLLSMLGAPDFVGKFRAIAKDLGKMVDKILGPILQPLKNAVAKLKQKILDYFFQKAFGITLTDLKAKLKSPETYFDKVMNNRGRDGKANAASLASLKAEWKLGNSGTWNVNDVPAAYNTVLMSKLILLPPSEIERLIRDLGRSAKLGEENVMLGFNGKLDGSRQWKANAAGGGAIVFERAGVYDRLFLSFKGSGAVEKEDTNASSVPKSVPPWTPCVEEGISWFGTAPFCGATKSDCTKRGLIYVGESSTGNGQKCLTGKKVKCRKPKPGEKTPLRELWVGTAPFCGGNAKDCTKRGMDYVRSDSRGDGKKCLTGKKVLCRERK